MRWHRAKRRPLRLTRISHLSSRPSTFVCTRSVHRVHGPLVLVLDALHSRSDWKGTRSSFICASRMA